MFTKGLHTCHKGFVEKLNLPLKQRCPTHLSLATSGEWPFKCGEWLTFQLSQNWVVFNKICDKIRNFQFNSHFSVKKP